jgi:RHS repeat-associated protein
LNQLTAFSRGQLNAAKDTIGTPVHSQSLTMDGLGNFTMTASNNQPVTLTYNAQNEIASTTFGVTPTYDHNGNMTRDPNGREYIYDAWNRMVQVPNRGNPPPALYTFDALGRRIQENDSGYVRDLYFSADWQVIEERVPAGQAGMTQQVWSPMNVDALVLRDRATMANATLDERLYVQQDANWNVTAVVCATGAVRERYVYDPYGRFTDPTGQTTTVLNPDWSTRTGGSAVAWVYLFQGGRYDNASGLYNFRNRDYSPALGRWMEVDPKRYKAGDTNLYRYELNEPTSATDPSGLRGEDQRYTGGFKLSALSPKKFK